MNGAVAVLVGIAGTQEHHIDGERLVEQPLLALDLDDLHQVLLGDIVEFAAAVAGVGKGVQAHVGDGADVVGRDVPVHVGDDALGQVIRLDLVAQGQIAQLGGPVVAAGAVPVALARREEQRQIAGMARLQEPLLQCLGQRLRAGAADKAAGGDGIAVVHQQRRLLGGKHANFFHA